MSSRPKSSPRRAREQLAQEAARLMAEEDIDDPFAARHKAAQRLDLTTARDLPGGEEILAALSGYLDLFQSAPHRQRLRELRQTARVAMRMLAPIGEVRLVGPVLNGTAVASTPVTLHLLGINPEEVAIHLLEQRITYRESACSVDYGPRDRREASSFIMQMNDITVEAVVFPPDSPRQAPLCPITGRAQKRAGSNAVKRLLTE
jgi:hypothetical protein